MQNWSQYCSSFSWVYFFHLIFISQGGSPLGLKTTVPDRGGEMGAGHLWGYPGQTQAIRKQRWEGEEQGAS